MWLWCPSITHPQKRPLPWQQFQFQQKSQFNFKNICLTQRCQSSQCCPCSGTPVNTLSAIRVPPLLRYCPLSTLGLMVPCSQILGIASEKFHLFSCPMPSPPSSAIDGAAGNRKTGETSVRPIFHHFLVIVSHDKSCQIPKHNQAGKNTPHPPPLLLRYHGCWWGTTTAPKVFWVQG